MCVGGRERERARAEEGRVREIEREGGGVDGVKERGREVGREGEEGGEKTRVCVCMCMCMCVGESACVRLRVCVCGKDRMFVCLRVREGF